MARLARCAGARGNPAGARADHPRPDARSPALPGGGRRRAGGLADGRRVGGVHVSRRRLRGRILDAALPATPPYLFAPERGGVEPDRHEFRQGPATREHPARPARRPPQRPLLSPRARAARRRHLARAAAHRAADCASRLRPLARASRRVARRRPRVHSRHPPRAGARRVLPAVVSRRSHAPPARSHAAAGKHAPREGAAQRRLQGTRARAAGGLLRPPLRH